MIQHRLGRTPPCKTWSNRQPTMDHDDRLDEHAPGVLPRGSRSARYCWPTRSCTMASVSASFGRRVWGLRPARRAVFRGLRVGGGLLALARRCRSLRIHKQRSKSVDSGGESFSGPVLHFMADGEESYGRGQEKGVRYTQELIDYFAAPAAKYEKVRNEPWLHVEPDPPRPQQGP